MKEIIRVKAERLADFYRKKYNNAHGELYSDRRQDTFATHLIRLSTFDGYVYKDILGDLEQKIVDAFFEKDNEYKFNMLVSELMMIAAKEAFQKMGRNDQAIQIFVRLRPVIQRIAFIIVIHEGVSSILEEEYLNFDEHG